MSYWLFKTEPASFSFGDLVSGPQQTAPWDGVRNYQARNYLREIEVGDRVFIYHSSIAMPEIVGTATIVRAAYPDHTAWNVKGHHFDPKSTPEKPIWYMVDVQAEKQLDRPITLLELKADSLLRHLSLFARPRLSIHPISEVEWEHIFRLSHKKSAQ